MDILANPRLERVKSEIEKLKVKIPEMQERLRVLERQRTDLENERIITIMRSEQVSDADVFALMRSIRSEDVDAAHDETDTATVAEAIAEPIITEQEEINDADQD